MADIDPAEIQRHLAGVTYPAKKDELIAAADRNGSPQEVIEELQALEREDFSDPGAVRTALGNRAGAY